MGTTGAEESMLTIGAEIIRVQTRLDNLRSQTAGL